MKSVQMRTMDVSNKVYDINCVVDHLMAIVIYGDSPAVLKEGVAKADCSMPPVLDVLSHTDKMCDDIHHKLCRLVGIMLGEGVAMQESTNIAPICVTETVGKRRY